MPAPAPMGAPSDSRGRGVLCGLAESATHKISFDLGRDSRRWEARARTDRGFTLIELMVTVIIFGVIAALAAPSFQGLMREVRLDSTTDQLYTQILAARSEAIKRGNPVILCRTANPLATNPACGGSTDIWSKGWLMYTYDDDSRALNTSDSNYNKTKGDVLLAAVEPSYDEYGVAVKSDADGNNWLVFLGDGSLSESGTANYAICDDRGVDNGRLITVFLDGGSRIDDLPTATVNSCNP